MRENAIRADLGDLRVSAVLFDEAFRLSPAKTGRNDITSRHRHTDYELFFILKGELSVWTRGQRIRAKAHSAVVIPPLLEHSTEAVSLQGYCMYFRIERKPKAPVLPYEAITEALQQQIRVLPLEEAGLFYIRQLEKAALAPPGQGEEIHLISLLFSELFRPLLPRRIPENNGKSLHYTNTIDLYIAEHYREKIRLPDLAKVLYLCPKQVTRIIRKAYGCTFSDLVHSHRLRLARALLESTEDSIADIARTVGYEYENYFYAQFRKSYSLTPAEYRAGRRSDRTE